MGVWHIRFVFAFSVVLVVSAEERKNQTEIIQNSKIIFYPVNRKYFFVIVSQRSSSLFLFVEVFIPQAQPLPQNRK